MELKLVMYKQKKERVNMKKAFTIVEVSILFVIFLIVAFLVAPLSLDDTLQAKNTAKWRRVQSDFENIFYSVNTQKSKEDFDFGDSFNSVMKGEFKSNTDTYKITYMSGAFPSNEYRFIDYKQTVGNRVIAYKFTENPKNDLQGYVMYDVNGLQGPNVWGKDVFGLNIYSDRFEPFCKNDPVSVQKQDCDKSGTGLCCSNYNLIWGNFD